MLRWMIFRLLMLLLMVWISKLLDFLGCWISGYLFGCCWYWCCWFSGSAELLVTGIDVLEARWLHLLAQPCDFLMDDRYLLERLDFWISGLMDDDVCWISGLLDTEVCWFFLDSRVLMLLFLLMLILLDLLDPWISGLLKLWASGFPGAAFDAHWLIS